METSHANPVAGFNQANPLPPALIRLTLQLSALCPIPFVENRLFKNEMHKLTMREPTMQPPIPDRTFDCKQFQLTPCVVRHSNQQLSGTFQQLESLSAIHQLLPPKQPAPPKQSDNLPEPMQPDNLNSSPPRLSNRPKTYKKKAPILASGIHKTPTRRIKEPAYPLSPETAEKIAEGWSCTHCGISATSQPRTGPLGRNTLCNGCGIAWRKFKVLPKVIKKSSAQAALAQAVQAALTKATQPLPA